MPHQCFSDEELIHLLIDSMSNSCYAVEIFERKRSMSLRQQTDRVKPLTKRKLSLGSAITWTYRVCASRRQRRDRRIFVERVNICRLLSQTPTVALVLYPRLR